MLVGAVGFSSFFKAFAGSLIALISVTLYSQLGHGGLLTLRKATS